MSPETPVQAAPTAENGILYVGPTWTDAQEDVVRERWPELEVESINSALTRINLSATPRGRCPGFNDEELLGLLSRTAPGVMVVGFFCDGQNGAEGVRIFESGRQLERSRVEWSNAPVPDPIAWPIAALAMHLRVSVETVTRVARPPRPELAIAVEALVRGTPVASEELLHTALDVLGKIPIDEGTAAIVKHLDSENWVTRFHAAKSYASIPRFQGVDGRPRLESLLDDTDESVREATLEGILELLPAVAYSDESLHDQIDKAAARGLKDEDEDVRATAERVQALRAKLLG